MRTAQINITEASSPKNAATIDKDGLPGNTYTKNEIKDEISKSFVGSVKGEAIPSTVPTPYNPTTHPNGLYEKYDVMTAGTYTNFKNSSNASIVISGSDLDKKQVQLWVENGVAKKVITEMPVITASSVFDPTNNVDAATMKASAEYFGFKEKIFTPILDFSKNLYHRYTKISSVITFSESSEGVFGNMNFLKLTGGDVEFSSNFYAQQGSEAYTPNKTNVITLWKEYDNIRYFIETFPLEIISDPNIITDYDFSNQTPNANLSTISHVGKAFEGKTSYFNINSAGSMLVTNHAADNYTDVIRINKGADVTNYRISMSMAFGSAFIFSPNDPTGTTFTDFFRVIKDSPSKIVHHTPSGGTDIIATTTAIPISASTGYYWEIIIENGVMKLYINSQFVVEYPITQSGNYFSMGFTAVGDMMNSFKMEKL